MAGSTHSGSHHSGGGFHGSSGSSGGSVFHHTAHGGYASDDGLYGFFTFLLRRMSTYVTITLFYTLVVVGVPGLNMINVTFFLIAIVLFILAIRGTGDSDSLWQLRKGKPLEGLAAVCRKTTGKKPSEARGNDDTWVGDRGAFTISFCYKGTRENNIRRVREEMQRTPAILWITPVLWVIISVVCFIVNFFFYEAVIPTFENMILSDTAFGFIDELVFYTPSLIALLSSITCFILRKIKDSVLYNCAEMIVVIKEAEERNRKMQKNSKHALKSTTNDTN